jgi:transposase
MASAFCADRRERVVAAMEAGASRREAARHFEISPASAVRWHETFVREGRPQAKPIGGDQRSRAIEARAGLIRQSYEARPELFLHELRDRLTERGLRVGVGSLSRFFKRHGISRQKTPATPPSRSGRTGKQRACPGSSVSSISARTGSCSSTRPPPTRGWCVATGGLHAANAAGSPRQIYHPVPAGGRAHDPDMETARLIPRCRSIKSSAAAAQAAHRSMALQAQDLVGRAYERHHEAAGERAYHRVSEALQEHLGQSFRLVAWIGGRTAEPHLPKNGGRTVARRSGANAAPQAPTERVQQ